MAGHRVHPLAWLLPILTVGWRSPGHADSCAHLRGDKQAQVDKLLRSTRAYECCDETLDRCLSRPKVCRLATRLRDDICKRVAAGQGEARIKTALERRARSMMPAKRTSIDLSAYEPAGDPKAKVVVVAYACTRCPFCARVVPELHRLVTTGSLKGKVVLYFKPYPISNHAGSKEGGLALLAAAKMKKLWPFALKLYGEFERFDVKKLPDWATQLGLDRDAFRREMDSPQTLQRLLESKKEGIRNGVDVTPTLFFDGRKYQGELGREVLPDVLEEEVDRVAGRQY